MTEESGTNRRKFLAGGGATILGASMLSTGIASAATELTEAEIDTIRANADTIMIRNSEPANDPGRCAAALQIAQIIDAARAPDPDPDPDGTVTLTSDAAANTLVLQEAIDTYNNIVVNCGGQLRGVTEPIEIRSATLNFGVGEGIRQLKRGASGGSNSAPVFRSTGLVTDRVSLSSVPSGSTISGLPSQYNEGDWIYIQTYTRYDTIHGYDDGFMRQLGANGALNKPLPRNLSNVEVFKVTPTTPVINGGIFEQAHPEDSYFDPIIEFLASSPRTSNIEVRSGGASGVFHSLNMNLVHENIYVHDLLDDDDLNGWRRESNPDQLVPNPNGRRHYGYGIYYAQANFGGTVSGRITHCRHAISTGDSSGKQGFFSGQNEKSGHPENIVHRNLIMDSCWSTNLSPHENGHELVFEDCESIDGGRLQNDYGSTDLQENPDHVNYRADMVLRNFTCTNRPGSNTSKSDGISMGHNDLRTDGTQPTIVLDGVTIKGGNKGIDTRANVIIEGGGLTIESTGSVGIHAQGEASIVGGPVTLVGSNANQIIKASTATVDIF